MTKKYRNKKQRTRKRKYTRKRYTRKNKTQYGGKERKNVKKPTKNNLMKTLNNEFSSGFFVIDTGLGRSAQPNRIKKLENIFFQREQAKNNTPQEKLSSVKVKPQQKNSGDTLMGAISRGLTEGRQARSQVQTALSTARSTFDSVTSSLGVPEARISNSLSGIGKQVGMLGKSQGKKTASRAISRSASSRGKLPPRGPQRPTQLPPPGAQRPTPGQPPRSTPGQLPEQPPGQPPEQPPGSPPEQPPRQRREQRQAVLATGSKIPVSVNTPQNPVCPCCRYTVSDTKNKICGVIEGGEDACINFFKQKEEAKKKRER